MTSVIENSMSVGGRTHENQLPEALPELQLNDHLIQIKPCQDLVSETTCLISFRGKCFPGQAVALIEPCPMRFSGVIR